jgi:hypothetical protein
MWVLQGIEPYRYRNLGRFANKLGVKNNLAHGSLNEPNNTTMSLK